MAERLAQAQTEAVRLSAGYAAAFIRSEGQGGAVPRTDSRAYQGVSRDGRPLPDALRSPLIAVRVALGEGRGASEALRIGLAKAERRVAFEVLQTARDALLDTIRADERLTGFRRSVSGTCAACMALSGTSGPRFEVHPGCECVPMPTVRGARERIALPTGAALFAALSKPEQEKAVGIEAAALIRSGEADLKDFVAHSRQEEQPDFLTQKPAQQVAT